MIDFLRKLTPLSFRRRIGPYIGYLAYWWRTRITGRTWEPTVLTSEETLELLRKDNLSIIRFGDGELSLITGLDLGFQKYEPALASKLREILASDDPRLVVAIPRIFGRIEHLSSVSFWFEIHHLFRYGKLWRSLLDSKRTYGDAFITRPYLNYRNKAGAAEIYRLVKLLWDDVDVVLLEGEKSRLGVGNDLFSNTRTLRRILCPAENAFAKSAEIIEQTTSLPKDTLVLISLGPAAKTIGFELMKLNYRVLDIGHLDMEYEMFLRQSEKLVPVAHKYFNEIDYRQPEDCTDPEYQRQIIAKIL